MTVYVDALMQCTPSPKWPYTTACHMMADNETELHAMAKRLGLRREWFQNQHINPRMHHYDLTSSRRARALVLGAKEITGQEQYRRLWKPEESTRPPASASTEHQAAALIPSTQSTLYTFGYLSSKAERIITELVTLHIPLVDVRFNPDSKDWRYKQEALRARPGVTYIHIKELGNRLYKEALSGKFTEPRIEIDAPAPGLARLKQEALDPYGKAAIFCVCASKTTCHRVTVANLAAEKLGVKIVHL